MRASYLWLIKGCVVVVWCQGRPPSIIDEFTVEWHSLGVNTRSINRYCSSDRRREQIDSGDLCVSVIKTDTDRSIHTRDWEC